jgi:hypothetical protein
MFNRRLKVETLSTFQPSRFQFSAFRFPLSAFSFFSASAAVRIGGRGKSFFSFSVFRFPFSVFRLLPPVESTSFIF